MVRCLISFHYLLLYGKKIIKKKNYYLRRIIELWDSFSNNIQLWSKRLLKNCDVEIMLKGGGRMKGEYMFTIDS